MFTANNQLMEILRDPVWQAAGVVVALVTIFLTQRKRKAISYVIVTDTPLVSVRKGEELKEKLQLSFDGKPVENIHLVLIRIMNSGNVPITSEDYESPIRIVLGSNDRVLTAEIVSLDPENIDAQVSCEDSSVTLYVKLLNQHDEISIKMLAVRSSQDVNLIGRIVGVKKISPLLTDKGSMVLGGLAILAALLGFGADAVGTLLTGKNWTVGSDTATPFSVVLIWIFIYRNKALLRRSFLRRGKNASA